MKKILLSASLICMTLFSFAQDWSVRGGLNISNLKFEVDGGSVSPDSRLGYQVGAMYDASLSAENCGYQLGLLLTSKGAKTELYGNDVKLNFTYLQFQAGFTYTVEKLKFNVGPFVAYGVGGKTKTTIDGEDFKEDSFGNDGVDNLDYGLTLGASYDLSKLYIYAGYDLGLADIDGDSDVKTRTRNFAVGLGYRF